MSDGVLLAGRDSLWTLTGDGDLLACLAYMSADWSNQSPAMLQAVARGDRDLVEVRRVSIFIGQFHRRSPLDERLSWKYFFACRYDAHPYEFTSDGLRPVKAP